MKFIITACVIRELAQTVDLGTETTPIDQLKAELEMECGRTGEITHKCSNVTVVEEPSDFYQEPAPRPWDSTVDY